MRTPLTCLLAVHAALLAGAATDVRVCAGCHREEARTQPHTAMGHALEPVAQCTILKNNPKLVFRQAPYSYEIVRDGDASVYTVTDGARSIRVPLAWAFGLGFAGQTYVYSYNGNLYESRVSFYNQTGALDLTIGATRAAPKDLEEAAGRLMHQQDALECFACHATNASKDGRLDVASMSAGVLCERCHEGVARHLESLRASSAAPAPPPRLGKLTTDEMSDFCGECHRTWETIALNGPRGVANVRFQPYRIARSKCYDAADPRIGCVACHDPHRPAEQTASFYDGKCLACHAALKKCPVGAKDCASCHMPAYGLEGSHHQFHDHNIRVAKAGDAYPD